MHCSLMFNSAMLTTCCVCMSCLQAVSERVVFEAVACWSQYGGSVSTSSTPAHATATLPPATASATRPAQEVEHVLQLVRFVLMSESDLEVVRNHPFTARYPSVLQLISHDLEQATAMRAGRYCLENKRLVKPAGVSQVCPVVLSRVTVPAMHTNGCDPNKV